MGIKFSEIPDKLPYNNIKFLSNKGKISALHSDIVLYISNNFSGTFKQKNQIIDLMNSVTYRCVTGEFLSDWDSSAPFKNIESLLVDDTECKLLLQSSYISQKDVIWDIDIVNVNTEPNSSKNIHDVEVTASKVVIPDKVTDKSDLYIQPPIIPRFDVNSVYVNKVIDGNLYTIYSSLPRIPNKQNEISVTTDVSLFTSSDLLRLFPTQFIPTRSKSMYIQYPGLEYDDKLGVIFPIDGFTIDQIRTNIIEYPHLYRLMKCIDNDISSFYTSIEIDGHLYKVNDIYKELPEFSKIPYTSDFIKEYVVRRYLLERDILGIHHNYRMYGSLDPFLTLFMTPDEYAKYGYTDSVDIARKCVQSRVSYKKSRNPVLRRIKDA